MPLHPPLPADSLPHLGAQHALRSLPPGLPPTSCLLPSRRLRHRWRPMLALARVRRFSVVGYTSVDLLIITCPVYLPSLPVACCLMYMLSYLLLSLPFTCPFYLLSPAAFMHRLVGAPLYAYAPLIPCHYPAFAADFSPLFLPPRGVILCWRLRCARGQAAMAARWPCIAPKRGYAPISVPSTYNLRYLRATGMRVRVDGAPLAAGGADEPLASLPPPISSLPLPPSLLS